MIFEINQPNGKVWHDVCDMISERRNSSILHIVVMNSKLIHKLGFGLIEIVCYMLKKGSSGDEPFLHAGSVNYWRSPMQGT